jgi:PrgI family protein
MGGMPARVPQDVDLEDRLVFNLTVTQFGYLVIGALGAAITWKIPWAPAPVRLLAVAPLVLCGVALAWGRWQGRPLDAWTGDALVFLRQNLRLRWEPVGIAGALRRTRMRRHSRAPRTWRRHRPPRPRPLALPEHQE